MSGENKSALSDEWGNLPIPISPLHGIFIPILREKTSPVKNVLEVCEKMLNWKPKLLLPEPGKSGLQRVIFLFKVDFFYFKKEKS